MMFRSILILCLFCKCTKTLSSYSGPSLTVPKNSPSTNPPVSVAPVEDDSSELVDWLMRYGYLPPPDPSTGQLQAWTAVTHAVKSMQRFAGLMETGVVDQDTTALMKSPRCSLPDQEEPPGQPANQHQGGRGSLKRKRRTAGSTWTRRSINWRLRSYPFSSDLSRETIRSLVYYALRVWAEPTSLEFHEVAGPEGADLQVDFLHGHHGDGYPFDGPGGAVGHAFFPSDPRRAGVVHLDSEEDWSFRKPGSEGTDLFTVLVHEVGHALGLAHSSDRRSVMRPYYLGPAGDPLGYSLGPRDRERITDLYGKRAELLTTDAPHLSPDPRLRHRGPGRHGDFIDRCNTSFDAVAKLRGETFFFKGQSMWRVSRGGLVSGHGASIRRLWTGLPDPLPTLQAVLERKRDHGIMFISESRVWLFQDLSLQEGYPRPLSDLRLDTRDGGTTPGLNGLVWDSEEGPVWGVMGEPAEKDNDTWASLLQAGVNGITTDTGDSIYLFKGDRYWKFLFPGSSPEPGYPRPMAADWLDCPDTSSPMPADVSPSFHPVGRQGVQEKWREERVGPVAEGKDKEHENGVQHGDGERSRPQLRACICSTAPVTRTAPLSTALLLGTWILSAM
ncbi:matrix metalloproteinase-17b isoform X1 [Gadus macrocephalus]|uniref:matrix metalloproteinase-17b isoform X1 n=2 Tax=Gadus macrocephalus TaxID=80720 RepID=UPI0028CB7129|nr:matrix metalloproteinase-17b isoform X1 [Gadus macrocephalus]XP_059919868.1 matrix metalloproteinase-17b isoform X1 [Gadus macrocephalus]XP_059919869.1 matrix metalloproteinase-17b isoform X1 [Gadus macrocephalus]